jgi:hypothetical protein
MKKLVLIESLLVIGILGQCCGDGSGGGEYCDAYLDENIGRYVVEHPSKGMRWMKCPLGQVWSSQKCACTGTATGMSFEEALEACPVGYGFPSSEDMSSVLAYIGLTNACPEPEQYESCIESTICNHMFGDDTGVYPTSEYEEKEEFFLTCAFDFANGCIYYDADQGNVYNVRCIEE